MNLAELQPVAVQAFEELQSAFEDAVITGFEAAGLEKLTEESAKAFWEAYAKKRNANLEALMAKISPILEAVMKPAVQEEKKEGTKKPRKKPEKKSKAKEEKQAASQPHEEANGALPSETS